LDAAGKKLLTAKDAKKIRNVREGIHRDESFAFFADFLCSFAVKSFPTARRHLLDRYN
jgi:hypothetical protein